MCNVSESCTAALGIEVNGEHVVERDCVKCVSQTIRKRVCAGLALQFRTLCTPFQSSTPYTHASHARRAPFINSEMNNSITNHSVINLFQNYHSKNICSLRNEEEVFLLSILIRSDDELSAREELYLNECRFPQKESFPNGRDVVHVFDERIIKISNSVWTSTNSLESHSSTSNLRR